MGDYFRDAVLHNIVVLPISEAYLSAYNDVPLMDEHKDPFDRLIIATAFFDNLSIITTDKKFDLYKDLINIIW